MEKTANLQQRSIMRYKSVLLIVINTSILVIGIICVLFVREKKLEFCRVACQSTLQVDCAYVEVFGPNMACDLTRVPFQQSE